MITKVIKTNKTSAANCNRLPSSSLTETKAYFLSFSATDNNGEGRRSVVNLRISVKDTNDNAPAFTKKNYVASIDEGQTKFQPRLILKANGNPHISVVE